MAEFRYWFGRVGGGKSVSWIEEWVGWFGLVWFRFGKRLGKRLGKRINISLQARLGCYVSEGPTSTAAAVAAAAAATDDDETFNYL